MKKAFWEMPNPKKKSESLGPEGRRLAQQMAAKAGRPYPNAVDNAQAARRT